MVSYIIKNTDSGGEFYIPPFSSIHVGTGFDPHRDNLQGIWNALRLANDASLTTRYGDETPSPLAPFICVKDLPDPIAMLAIVANYEYQACEFTDWYSSKAKAICDSIRDLAICKLPGYGMAPWGFDGPVEPDPYFEAPKLSSVDKPEPGKAYRLI